MNGKGSKRRIGEDVKKIRENWDKIKWPSKEKNKKKIAKKSKQI